MSRLTAPQQNLLLISPTQDDSSLPLLKVADFGFARFLPNATLADTLCGSPLYMGPEILSYQKYDAKADLWSVGAVLYEMVTGRPPFQAQNHLDLLKKIQENEDRIVFPDERPSSDPNAPDKVGVGSDLKDLIRKLLKKDPVERISFEELFLHPAITNTIPVSPSPSVSTSSTKHKSPGSPSPATKHDHETSPYEPPPFAQSPATRHNFDWKKPQISPGRMSPVMRDAR